MSTFLNSYNSSYSNRIKLCFHSYLLTVEMCWCVVREDRSPLLADLPVAEMDIGIFLCPC